MAISFSRPDPSSPSAVGAASFPVAKRGFDQGEVRDFLRMVAAELARLQERERFLEAEMRAMQTRGMSSPGRLDEETVTTLLGEEAARVLSTARDASAQIRDRAEESATRLVKDAAEDAARIRESAILEAQRLRDDATADAEAEIEMAKQHGRDMVNEAREYREKVLSELSRRRDAARAQIEQLLHGRDRLLSAFERARLATDDVIGGLTEAHDEPEFIVNLSPVTGPIPVISPEHPSLGVHDETTSLIFDHENEEQTVIDDAVIEIIGKSTEDTESVDVLEPGVEDIVGDIADEIVVINPVVDTPDEIEVQEEVVELPDEETITETTSAQVTAIETTSVESDDSKSDDAELSNVVSLFGRERVAPVLPEVEPEAETAKEPTQLVISEVKPEKVERKSDYKVDDIFARLRADTTSSVAQAATQTIKTRKVVGPEVFDQRNELLAPLVVQFSRKLKRVLADEQNNVMEYLRKKRSVLEIDSILGTIEEHAQRYRDAISEETTKAGAEGAKTMKSHGGSSRRVTKKELDVVVQRAIAESLVAKFREDTRIAIGEAEGDRDILAGLMRDVYRQWKMTSLDEHVDDVACASFSCGAYLSLEPDAQLMWVVTPNGGCCSDCSDNSLAEAVTKGTDFPTGHRHPLAHVGCRCLVLPISH